MAKKSKKLNVVKLIALILFLALIAAGITLAVIGFVKEGKFQSENEIAISIAKKSDNAKSLINAMRAASDYANALDLIWIGAMFGGAGVLFGAGYILGSKK